MSLFLFFLFALFVVGFGGRFAQRGEFVDALAELNDVVHASQNVQQADAADGSANGAVFEEGCDPGRLQFASQKIQEEVVIPPRSPG